MKLTYKLSAMGDAAMLLAKICGKTSEDGNTTVSKFKSNEVKIDRKKEEITITHAGKLEVVRVFANFWCKGAPERIEI